MDINNIKEGQVVKNYKELCTILEEPNKTGKSKQLQLKDWERYFKFHKQGNKIVIDEIYDNVISKVSNREKIILANKSRMIIYENLKIDKSEWYNYGVYYIIKNNDVYIGSTIKEFRKRFQEHYQGNDKYMKHTYELLQNGGEFHILHDMTGIEDEVLIRRVENEYINYFYNYTDYNVINKKEEAWSIKEKTKINYKYKTIKIREDKYNELIELINNNELSNYLKINNNKKESNKKSNTINLIDENFDYKNIPF